MKIELKNKWRKVEIVNLHINHATSSSLASIEIKWWNLTQARYLSIYLAMHI